MPLTFDGIDDRISTANRTGGPTAYPFSAIGVMRLTDISNAHSFLEYGFGANATTGFLLTPVDGSGLPARWYIGTVVAADTGASLAPNNTWIFLGASSLNATTHRIYMYNYETRSVVANVSTSTSATFTNPTSSFFHIGMDTGDDSTYADFLTGIISYVAVYNKDFTGNNGDAFLAMAHLGPYAVATPTLLYDFNEMAGTTIRDKIANANDGTMTNFPASPWVENSLPAPFWEIGGRRRVSRPAIVSAGGGLVTRKTLMGVGI